MEATLSLDIAHASQAGDALVGSLRDSDAVQYRFEEQDGLRITITANGLGPLRGATNTALMLAKLSTNVMTYEE
jgi:tRNA threonylcarbamoyladenosine modification (KEOPS) complex  Pcc1 subunit